MRSWFTQRPAASPKKQDDEAQAQAAQMLSAAEGALNKLRVATQEDWPLLNQATRLVLELEKHAMKLDSEELRAVWRR